jgi:N-acetylneuraminate lyase
MLFKINLIKLFKISIMTTQHLEGLIAAPFTPMHVDGSLNLTIIPAYYEFLKANGITGAFICGSTGEGVSMTNTEKKHIAQAWASCTKGDHDFKVMMFLGGTSIADCKDLALYSQQVGLYAVSFTAPFYFRPANVEVLAQLVKKWRPLFQICLFIIIIFPCLPA